MPSHFLLSLIIIHAFAYIVNRKHKNNAKK
nr:MAG TPA: hypothetical protein [Caudoviricetes sp.]